MASQIINDIRGPEFGYVEVDDEKNVTVHIKKMKVECEFDSRELKKSLEKGRDDNMDDVLIRHTTTSQLELSYSNQSILIYKEDLISLLGNLP